MNQSKTRTAVPRYRPHGGAAILSQGFRPFFLAAGVWAIVGLALSLGMILGQLDLPTLLSPIDWHIHEMVYGYVAAVIVGFLFTAIPNWTGRMPLQGQALLWLVVLWMAGRVAALGSLWLGFWTAAIIDLLFLVVVFAVLTREILAGRNWRNTPVLVIVALLAASNGLFFLEAAQLINWGGFSKRLAVGIIVLLIALIGGRVIPSFTRNWLAKRQVSRLPASFGRFDQGTLLLTAVALVAWSLEPSQPVARALAGAAALANLLRLLRWSGHLTLREPLLVVLHLGYLWIPVGLALLALGDWLSLLPASAALHAFTVGAIGTMTLAMMCRVTLGHTGRALHAGPALTLAFGLMTLSAVARLIAPLAPELYMALLIAAEVTWMLAFALYIAVCGTMLAAPRLPKTT